jgi:hypothetical protein
MGVSVAIAAADCSGAGGVQLTLVDSHGGQIGEAQFVCNGLTGPQGPQGSIGATGPTGPAGTTGQSSTTYSSTGSIFTNGTSTVQGTCAAGVIPGFPQTITVPAGVDVVLQADGGLLVNNAGTTTFSAADVFLMIDGTNFLAGNFFGFRRVYAQNNGLSTAANTPWSLTRRVSLSAGQHTVGLCGVTVMIPNNTQGVVGGAPNTTTMAALTVTLIKQ